MWALPAAVGSGKPFPPNTHSFPRGWLKCADCTSLTVKYKNEQGARAGPKAGLEDEDSLAEEVTAPGRRHSPLYSRKAYLA